jgi:hypothetical protein
MIAKERSILIAAGGCFRLLGMAETMLFKNKLFPPMMIAILLTLTQFVLGGGTDTRVVPASRYALF